jgi:hypothetical protein
MVRSHQTSLLHKSQDFCHLIRIGNLYVPLPKHLEISFHVLVQRQEGRGACSNTAFQSEAQTFWDSTHPAFLLCLQAWFITLLSSASLQGPAHLQQGSCRREQDSRVQVTLWPVTEGTSEHLVSRRKHTSPTLFSPPQSPCSHSGTSFPLPRLSVALGYLTITK